MPEEIKPNVSEAASEDAKLAAESIASGEEKVPNVDMEADYQAAQQYSQGKALAEPEGTKETAPEVQPISAQPTGNPEDYQQMAKEVGHSEPAVNKVTDDLVEQAIDRGTSK